MAFSFAFPCHQDCIQIFPCQCILLRGWKRQKSSVLTWTALYVLFNSLLQLSINKKAINIKQICIQTSSKRKSIVQVLCHFVDKKKGIPRSFTPDDLYFFNFFKHLSQHLHVLSIFRWLSQCRCMPCNNRACMALQNTEQTSHGVKIVV